MRLAAAAALLASCFAAAAQHGENGFQQAPPSSWESESLTPTDPAEEPFAEDDLQEFAPDPLIAGVQRAFDEAAAPAGGAAGQAGAPPEPRSFWTQALKSLAVLALLCAIIILGGALLRRAGSRTPLLAGPRLGTPLGKIHLNPRASLHFVRAGGRVLVVGVTPQSLSLITEFDASAFEEAAAEPSAAAPDPGGFLTALRGRMKETAAAAPARADDELDALRGDLQRLREYLQEPPRETP